MNIKKMEDDTFAVCKEIHDLIQFCSNHTECLVWLFDDTNW